MLCDTYSQLLFLQFLLVALECSIVIKLEYLPLLKYIVISVFVKCHFNKSIVIIYNQFGNKKGTISATNCLAILFYDFPEVSFIECKA